MVELLVERAEALVVTTLEEPAPPPDYYSRDEVERFHGTRDTQQLLFFTTAFALRGEFSRRADLSLAEALERTTDDFLPLGNVQLFPLAGGQTLARDFACISRNRINAVCLMPGTTQPIPPPDLPQTEMLPLGAD